MSPDKLHIFTYLLTHAAGSWTCIVCGWAAGACFPLGRGRKATPPGAVDRVGSLQRGLFVSCCWKPETTLSDCAKAKESVSCRRAPEWKRGARDNVGVPGTGHVRHETGPSSHSFSGLPASLLFSVITWSELALTPGPIPLSWLL